MVNDQEFMVCGAQPSNADYVDVNMPDTDYQAAFGGNSALMVLIFNDDTLAQIRLLYLQA